MARIAKILKNFTAFVDGVGQAGVVSEVELPKLTVKTEEHRAGGMDMPVEVDMGMEKMESTLTFDESDPAVLKRFGLADGNATSITLRGAQQAQGGEVEPIIINLRGRVKEIDQGSWKSGDKAQVKLQLAVNYYKATVNGGVVHEIDVENMVRKIGGTDQIAEIKKALGA